MTLFDYARKPRSLAARKGWRTRRRNEAASASHALRLKVARILRERMNLPPLAALEG